MKKLTILRGLPGDGKSTYARKQEQAYDAVICSADRQFERVDCGGYEFEYHWRKDRLRRAHAMCQHLCNEAMRDREPWIIIDNTNTRVADYAPYLDLAADHGYQVEIREFHGGYGSDHDVPEETMERMRKRWEPVPPEWEKYLAKD